jgi:2-polyprenyl-3-methyl-5-hydroxy-6-metoxy-1,4-benzoquinol methylase
LQTTSQAYFEYTRTEILPLLPENVSRVLEVGCGTGNTLTWLKTIKSCTWLGGVELNRNASAQASKVLDMVYTENIESFDLPIQEGTLDLILCLDVLEHLVDPWNALSRLKKNLKPGGALIVSIPNVRHKSVLLPLLFREEWKYTDFGILDKTHLRFFVKSSAVQMLESAGFKVDLINATGLGRSRRSKTMNSLLPSFIRSFFEKQYLIRGIKVG